MMNLELLFKASEISGDDTFKNIAISHSDKTILHHYRDDYSTWHVVDYDHETGAIRGKCTAQGAADDSAWARGQAWGLYGYTLAYRFTKDERYLQQAQHVVEFIFSHPNLPEDLVPYWDYNAPEIPNTPRDVSSAAIAASALYELYDMTKNKEYKALADTIIESLSSPAYRAEQGTNGGFILMHSVGSIPHNSNIDVPLNYADYYFLEALVRKRNIENGGSAVPM
jgi:rhamnogalacturonyl hydrolase YesR